MRRRRRHTALPPPTEKSAAVRSMFDRIAPRYDTVNRVMTFGLDKGWRRRAVDSLGLPAGGIVVDVACGTGDFCRMLQERGQFPVGIDFSMGMLVSATTSAPLVQADALRMPMADHAVDGITCGFALRNVVDLDELFRETARVLRVGGRLAIVEVAEPSNRVLKAGHSIYFRKVVPVIGGLLSDRDAYRYLPESTAYLPSPSELLRRLETAGFGDVKRKLMGAGAVQLITATRR